MGDLQPRMRAGDADRTHAVERLGVHLGDGRLTVEEFDERVTQAHAAVYLDQLPPLFTDLPPEPAPVPVARRPSGAVAWAPSAALVVLTALVVSWSMVMAVHGVPPIFPLLLLFVVLRHRRWSRRW